MYEHNKENHHANPELHISYPAANQKDLFLINQWQFNYYPISHPPQVLNQDKLRAHNQEQSEWVGDE